MYRVFLIPTDENPKSELWLDAHDVHEADEGTSWEFVDQENRVIRRLEKTRVKSFVVTPDRRNLVPWSTRACRIPVGQVAIDVETRSPRVPTER